ncbi:cadherin-like beta sandwich domain-containing protein [Globicatella sulfidifaciens]|uniref:receptor protein-tyrosine kinase n=1 Tax=Globicatella sulfidifaciens TaxID=136093 RepID=A0A7X8C211_9LACT|nr:cadherin-like beta sandwich domain-containing protein [Globicatella sulfidifaciens]NLJ17500.1 hypothetical protein [Globicatella sulfidifaciens]
MNTWEQSFIDVDGKRVDGHEGDGHVRITYYSNSVKDSTELNSIKLNGVELDGFDPEKREYTVEIDGEYVGEVEFVLDKRHIDQKIVGDTTIELTHHNVQKSFTVISADKTKEATYIINFVRKPSTKLFDLSIDEYKHSFTEKFEFNKYSYHLSSYVYGGVEVKYKTFDENATVIVQGDKEAELRPGNNKIIVKVSRDGLQDTIYEINAYRQRDLEFSYTGDIQKFKIPYTGTYKFELWGAQGGSREGDIEGGRGGYVSGDLTLTKDELVYINVGGKGDATHKGYNGGGKSAHDGEPTYGGGATDIRFGGIGLYNRVMVAGGGGAASTKYPGGAGGGDQGIDGAGDTNYIGKGASSSSSLGHVKGSFGQGGNGSRRYSDHNLGGAAGGGGFYGGGGAYEYYSDSGNSGGGGSGYVYTQESFKPENYSPSVKYYVSNAINLDGSKVMPGKEGHSVVGNEGDGFVRISLLNLYSTDSRLKYLEVSNGELNRKFDPEIYEYDLILEPDQYELVINVDTIDHNAYVSWENHKKQIIKPGITEYNFLVTAQDGSTSTYTLRVHRPASDSSTLADLKINGETIDNFDPEKLEYKLNLSYDSSRDAKLSWTASRPAQNITGNENVVFENKKAEIITVISENGKNISEYKIIPVIEDSNLLRNLDIQEANFEFDPEVFSYELQVPLGVSSLSINAIPYDHEATVKIEGSGYLRVGKNKVTITVSEPNLESQTYVLHVLRCETADGSIDTEYDFKYTGNTQYFEAPYTGRYKLEAWGAEGGNRGKALGGKGGYSSGVVSLKKGEIIAVEVGGAGTKEQKGYNGGGISGTANVYGGGASDIRVGSYSLYDRILVAGGGGSVGAASRGGAAGGGTLGLSSKQNYGSGGQGGTQTEAGLYGDFGVGGNGLYQNNGRGGAGGGGWYGGGGVRPDRSVDDDRGGGGGSGYIFTSNSYKPEGYDVDERYYLTEATTISGNAQLPDKNGGYALGNSGNGFVRITALRQISTDNYLSDIQLNKGAELSSIFDPEVTEYELNLDVNHTTLEVKGITSDPYASVEGNGSYLIPAEGKKIELIVTAEDGSIRMYILNVSRPASDEATPKNIEVTGLIPSLCELSDEYCQFSPEFDINGTIENGTGVYSMIVPSRIRSIEFSVIKSHEFQNVIGGGVIELEPGSENTVYIEVGSEDDSNYASYIFNIDRDMTGNADLETLNILNPKRELEFNPDITEYYVSIPNEFTHTDELEIEIETMDPLADFSVVKGEGPLELGNNVYEILVTANNGLTKKYTINLYREQSSNTFLSKLLIKNDEEILRMSPNFTKTIKDYVLTVENDVDHIDVIALAESDRAEVNLVSDGRFDLNVGSNEINILVTAEDGTSSTYRLTVIRKESNNTKIKQITLDGTVLEDFDPQSLHQTIEVDSQIIRPKLEVELESDVASFVISGSYNTFSIGSNFVYVRVTSESGYVETYTIEFIKDVSEDTRLVSIETNLFDISSKFDSEVDIYNINIPYSEEALIIDAQPKHKTSKVKGNGTYHLSSGMNEIKLEVIAEDGSIGSYILNINMLKNTNASLEGIELSSGVLDPVFEPHITTYAVNVPNDVKVLDIQGIPSVESTVIEGNGEYLLDLGLNTIDIMTKAENGNRMTYTINVIRDVSKNADLSYLVVHEGALNRKFESNILEYDIKVPYGTKRLNIEASVVDPSANYTILNANNLIQGLNRVIIRVTPGDGVGFKDYILNVYVQGPASINIDLNNLTISHGILKPDFLPIRQFYRVEVENSINEISINGLADEGVLVSGSGKHKLDVGKNLIVLTTESNNGITKDYQIEINRKPSSDAKLKLLNLSKIQSSYTFRPDRYNYNVSTRHTSLGINAIPNHDKATVEILGNANFVTNGKSVVIIRVTAEDKITVQDYTVTVNKLASHDNTLKSLSVSGVHLEPEFRSSRNTYKASVKENVRQVVISASANDPNAKVEYIPRQNLDVGINFLDVSVISESGRRNKYTIEIVREGSRNSNLSEIILDSNPLPNFSSEKLNYFLEFEYEKEWIDIDAVLEDDRSMLSGTGKIQLEVGTNYIPLTVTSENGDIKTYTLAVYRKEINSALLDDLRVDQYPFENDFTSNIFNYSLVIDNEFDKLNLDIIPKDPKADIEVIGNSNLSVGFNKIYINVVSSLKDKKETYTLNVYKQEYGNNFLAYLNTEKGNLVPSFYRGNMVYSLDVSQEVDQINIEAEAENVSSTIENIGIHNLEYGINKINVPVTSHNGVTRNYYVFVNRSMSNDNYLTSLQLKANGKNIAFSPDFDPKINKYTVPEKLEPGTESVDVITSSNAKDIKGTGSRKLEVGLNKLEVVVTSESGLENVYEIQVSREASDNNKLVSIEPSSGKLSPNFNYDEDTYDLYVDSATTTLSFDVVTEDKNATVSGADRQIVESGFSTREIKVTSESGMEKIYTINIHKDETNNALLKNLEFNGYELSPKFNSEIFTYTVTVPNDKTMVYKSEFSFETWDKNATVETTGSLSLLTGKVSNVFEFRVTAADDFTMETYRILIDRTEGNDSILENIEFANGNLDKKFHPHIYEYDLEFESGKSIFNRNEILRIETSDMNAQIKYSHDEDIKLVEGEVVPFVVSVISEDKSSETQYTFNITYIRSKDSLLSSINIENAIFTPEFSPDVFEYDVSVHEDITEVIVNAFPRDAKAKVISMLGKKELINKTSFVEIVVEAENKSLSTYKLNIKRNLSNRLDLKDIRLTNAQNGELFPKFNNTNNIYEARLSKEIDSIGLIIERGHESQEFKLYDKFNNLVDINDIPLDIGRNIYKLKVYSPFEDVKWIDFVFYREGNDNNYLKNLSIINPTIDIDFDRLTHEYFVEIPYNFESIELKAITEDSNSRVEILNNENLTVGNNDIIVRVEAENGDIRNYIIHAFRQGLYNNALQTITVSVDGKVISQDDKFFTPHFHKGITDYSVTVDSNVRIVTVEGVPYETSSIVTADSNNVISYTERGAEIQLQPGNNVVKLLSQDTAEGNVMIYTVNIIREMNNDASLIGLEVFDDTTLLEFNEGEFDSNRSFYSVEVDSDTDSLKVVASAGNPQSKIVITGNKYLMPGQNVVKVMVTSEDKTQIKLYKILVNKNLSSETGLQNLLIGENKNDLQPISLETEKIIHSVSSEVDKIWIEAESVDPLAIVSNTGEHALKFGENIIDLVVKAQDGSEKVHFVTILREFDLQLDNIKLSYGDLNPDFDSTIYEYSVYVPLDVQKININAKAKFPNDVKVEGNGWYDLKVGSNELKVRVYSNDGKEQLTKIKVVRQASSNTKIKHLDIKQGTLSPQFNSNIYQYDTYIRDVNDQVNLTVILEDVNASYEILNWDDVYINKENVTLSEIDVDSIEIIIRVEAEDGSTKDTALNIHRQPSALFSNKLTSLQVSPIKSISPKFNPNINNYVAIVDEEISEISIKATKESPDSEIVSGVGTFKVKPGRNVYDIVVRSKDGIDNVYKIVINQTVSSDASLSELTFEEGDLIPIFSRGRKDYRMNVPSHVETLTPHIKPYANGTTWKVSGGGITENLVMGENKVVVDTLAANGIGTDQYNVTVNKTNQTALYLKQIVSNTGEFLETFDKYNEGPYTLEIDSDTRSIILDAIPEQSEAVDRIEGIGLIEVGNVRKKLIEIDVYGKFGNKLTYYVNIIRKDTASALLSYLDVRPGELSPHFEPDIFEYEVEVPNDVETIQIMAQGKDNHSIEGDGIKQLKEGSNVFKIVITDDLGVANIYTIHVLREVNHTANIIELSFNETLIEYPKFDKDHLEYQLYVPYEVNELSIRELVLEDEEFASYRIEQEPLKLGSNKINIVVENEYSGDKKIYEFNVTRYAFSSNYLKELYTDQGPLSPAFDKHHNYYEIDVPYSVNEIELIGSKEDGTANEVGLGIHKDLNIGINELKVTVTSNSGVPRTYIVRVNRLQDSRNNLENLEVIGGTLSPEFNHSEFNEYTVNVDADVDEVTFVGEIPDTAQVKGLETVKINTEQQSHTIVVTAQDGSSKIYKFKIVKQLSGDAAVLNIIPSTSHLKPNFEQDAYEYEITVDEEITKIGFDVITSNKFAKVTGNEDKILKFGENEFEIKVVSEDQKNTTIYNIIVNRLKGAHEISISPDTLVINPGDTYQLDLNILPEDATDIEVEWTSDNEESLIVNEFGQIQGIKPGFAQITVIYKRNPKIKAIAYVEVMDLSLSSDDLQIVRDAKGVDPYVIGAKDRLTIEEFLALFNNEESILRVYDSLGKPIEDYDQFVATGMSVKLVINGVTYDELRIVVRGDIDGDGLILVNDLVQLRRSLYREITLDPLEVLASDLDGDGRILVNDLVQLRRYLYREIDDLNGGIE